MRQQLHMKTTQPQVRNRCGTEREETHRLTINIIYKNERNIKARKRWSNFLEVVFYTFWWNFEIFFKNNIKVSLLPSSVWSWSCSSAQLRVKVFKCSVGCHGNCPVFATESDLWGHPCSPYLREGVSVLDPRCPRAAQDCCWFFFLLIIDWLYVFLYTFRPSVSTTHEHFIQFFFYKSEFSLKWMDLLKKTTTLKCYIHQELLVCRFCHLHLNISKCSSANDSKTTTCFFLHKSLGFTVSSLD